MSLRRNLKVLPLSKKGVTLFLATGALVGYIPPLPGTLGALEGVLLYRLTLEMALYGKLIITVLLIFLGILTSGYVSLFLGKSDPDEVIIDEVAGAYISCLGKVTLWEFILALIIFRIIDITKPYPLKRLERLKGGWGIMLDDVLAGIMTNLLVSFIFSIHRFLL